ncbi:MAG: hypothetical protein MR696_09070 [Lachnospiraceae bacterium]|nr:hypothetical protein [Lachnospiraceae bacterium]
MKENRNAIYITTLLTIATLASAIFITYSEKIHKMFENPDFVVNCLIGIFSGSILALIVAIINYSVIKRQELTEFANFINCLNIEIVPVYYLFTGGERNIEHEIKLILSIYRCLVEKFHMKPCKLSFLFPKTKIEKKVDEIMEIVGELYKKVLDTKLLIDKYEFDMVCVNELDEKIQSLFMHLRNYDGEELFTNILSKKHEELLSLSHLEYQQSGKISF